MNSQEMYGRAMEPEQSASWVETLCQIAREWNARDAPSIRELFQRAAPEVEDAHFVEMVAERLGREPALVELWQQYSYDKRASPSPYLDGTEVGFFEVVDHEAHRRAVEHFDTVVEACASFIWRETGWVLQRRQVVSDPYD